MAKYMYMIDHEKPLTMKYRGVCSARDD